jgi:disulfide bond formation protein DsbB
LVIVSAFLVWLTLHGAGGAEEQFKGVGNDAGSLTMALGAIAFAIVVAILGLILAIRGRGRGLAIAGLVLAVFPLIVGAYASFAPEGAIVTFESKTSADDLGISQAEAKARIQAEFDSGRVSATAGMGAYLALAGSALALVASIAGIATAGRKPEVAAAPPLAASVDPGYPPPPPPPPPAPSAP